MIPAPGFLRLIDHMGSDASICRAARLSYGKADAERSADDDEKLIRYLLRHRHTSPFEQTAIQIHIKAPIFVMRQWMRHRTWAYNEISARYTVLPEEVFVPEVLHGQAADNKQGRGDPFGKDQSDAAIVDYYYAVGSAYSGYGVLLGYGVSREQARSVLPVAQYTEVVATVNLHNALHFLRLRLDPHAQAEIRAYAEELARIIADLYPATYRAWVDYSRDAPTLSRMEAEAIRAILRGDAPDLSQMSAREQREFRAAWGAGSPVDTPPAP